MELSGKTAVITGGGSGIGEATAKLFAREGARVMIIGRTEGELRSVARDIEAAGGVCLPHTADISDASAMQAAYSRVREHWGRLDIVFAHAGINGVWAPIDEITDDEWKKTIDINLTGTFYTVKYALPLLKEQGGSIIITSSVNGTRMFSNAGASAYSSSKAGQIAFMQMAALELAKHKIRVNAICPGAIATHVDDNTTRRDTEEAEEPVEFPEGEIPLTDGKPGASEQVAQLVLFLASDRASHISGTPVWIDGAQSLLQG